MSPRTGNPSVDWTSWKVLRDAFMAKRLISAARAMLLKGRSYWDDQRIYASEIHKEKEHLS
jgi:hypothetical protein